MNPQDEHIQAQINIFRNKAIAYLEMVDSPQDSEDFLKACTALARLQCYLDLNAADYPVTESVKF